MLSRLPLFALLLVTFSLAPTAQAVDWFRGSGGGGGSGSGGTKGEYIVVSGGPALREWENLRVEQARHDRWWGNFVRAARLRMEQIRARDPNATITWLVFKTAYEKRSIEDGEDRVAQVRSVQQKDSVQCRLIWFTGTDQLIRYLNQGGSGVSRSKLKIKSFDYFGHSNKYCFTFDYSGEVAGASKVFLHQDDIAKLKRGIFTRNAHCQSWGCHTGESMSKVWRAHTGVRMIGAHGKTDYSYCWQGTLPYISTPGGRWIR